MPILRDSLPGLEAFVLSMDSGSFSAAARLLGTTPSAVSKSVAKLEERLGVLLLHRSTRALRPTAEGRALHERGRQILVDLNEVEDMLTATQRPRGVLRLSAPLDLGRHWLIPKITAFLRLYPEIECDVSLTDRFVDLVDERLDVAVRMGESGDVRLIRKRLGNTGAWLCAAPGYLETFGTPETREALAEHNCLAYARGGRRLPWVFTTSDGTFELSPKGTFTSDNNDALIAAALSGVGIARIPNFMAREHVARGRLQSILSDHVSPGLNAYAMYPEQRHLSARVRVFVDFVATEFRRAPP